MIRRPPVSTPTDTRFPNTTLFRSIVQIVIGEIGGRAAGAVQPGQAIVVAVGTAIGIILRPAVIDPKVKVQPVGERIVEAADESVILDRRDQEVAPILALGKAAVRSEERRVGKEGVSTCRSRWSRIN